MHFEFSEVGFLFLVMLLVPIAIWTNNKPKAYGKYAPNENLFLFALERIGEVFVSIFALFCGAETDEVSFLLYVAFVLMILYEIYWIRYFRSERKMSDLYRSMFGIPLPGATLPVLAFILLGYESRNIFLIVFSILLGIGHVGIHLFHKKEVDRKRRLKQ